MEWASGSPCCSRRCPGQECCSPGMCSGWELEFRDRGAIPGWGLRLTAERQIQGMWGRRLWREMPVEERQAAMEARRYCWVTRRGWSHPHSLSLPRCQHLQLNNREAGPLKSRRTEQQRGPHPGCPFKCLTCRSTGRTPARGVLYVPDAWNNREQPQATEPFKRLNMGSCGEKLAKEAFWLPATRGLKKDTNRAMTPAMEAVCVSAHFMPPGSPQAKQLHHLHTQLSLGQTQGLQGSPRSKPQWKTHMQKWK